VSFFLTVMILGAMAAAWVTRSPRGEEGSYLSALWTAASFFIAADILFAAFVTPVFGLVGYRPKPSLRPPARISLFLHLGRLALLAGGLLLIVPPVSADIPGGLRSPLAFTLVLASEVAGRFLFYGLAPRPGD
jgi:DMSO reductase anchor subunit